MELSFVPSSNKDDNFKETYKDLCENGVVRGSPESGSLYSDYESGQQYEQDLPSGYNSGEQYDTISTGYMSGEAYELPETRPERMEPTLSIIQEMGGSSGSHCGDEEIFTIAIPAPPAGFPENQLLVQADLMDVSSSSSSSIPENLEMAPPIDPITAHKVKRKKQVSYCVSVPMDTSPLGGNLLNYNQLPSDTDTTSCVDSDGTYMKSELQSSDSGAALLHHSTSRKKKNNLHEASEPGIIKGSRKRTNKKVRKTNRRHDEFFLTHDSKYWDAARKVLFWCSIVSIVACIAVAVTMIVLMPRKCDPERAWWQGHVMLDIIPTTGSLGRPTIDLHDLMTKVPHLASAGIKTIKLKNVYLRNLDEEPGLNSAHWYACDDETFLHDRFDNTSLLGELANQLHGQNMTMMIEIPAVEQMANRRNMSMELKQAVERAIKYWAKLGVDGISVIGVEQFASDGWLVEESSDWKMVMDKYGTSINEKILTTSYLLPQKVEEFSQKETAEKRIVNFALLDAPMTLDMETTFNASQLSAAVNSPAKWDNAPSRPWINWNVGINNSPLNNAELAFHLFLPGTVTVPSSSLTNFTAPDNSTLAKLLKIRAAAVPVHMNGNYPVCHGDCENQKPAKETNHKITKTANNLLLLERHFNRRNRYMVIANLNQDETDLSTVKTYSGGELILDTSTIKQNNRYLNFKDARLKGSQAYVIKFPK